MVKYLGSIGFNQCKVAFILERCPAHAMVGAYLRYLHALLAGPMHGAQRGMGNRSRSRGQTARTESYRQGLRCLDCTPPQDNTVYFGLRLTVADLLYAMRP